MAIHLHEPKDQEQNLLIQLLKHFDWERNECFPNVMVFPWESDLLVVTSSGFVTEIEVKCSMSDWKADMAKSKFKDPHQRGLFQRSIKRFFYAVPAPLYAKFLAAPFDLPAGAGVLVHGTWGSAKFMEKHPAGTNVMAKSLPEKDRHRLQRSVYFRFTRQFLKGGIRAALPQEQP